MKKRTYLLVISIALFAASCTKSTSVNPYAVNAWYVAGQEYLQSTCTAGSSHQLLAISSSPSSILTASFASALPTKSSTYTVTGDSAGMSSDQVFFAFADTISHEYAVSIGGANQSVSVTVSSAGKVSMTGAGISLYNVKNGVSDTVTMVISLAQQ